MRIYQDRSKRRAYVGESVKATKENLNRIDYEMNALLNYIYALEDHIDELELKIIELEKY